MNSRRTQKRILASCVLLSLILFFHKPVSNFLNSFLEAKLQNWLKHYRLELKYDAVSLEWLGLRVSQVHLANRDMRGNGSLVLKWKLWPLHELMKPKRLILEHWHINWTRSPQAGPTSLAKKAPSPHSLQKFENLFEALMQQKIHLEIKNMHLKFLEDGEKPLLSVRDLSAEYTSDQRQINLSLQSLIYRSTPILRSMTGQLILDDPSADFPFLLSAQDNEKGHWQLQGKIAKNLDSIEFRHKRIGLPEILSPYLTIIQPQNNLKILMKLRLSNLKSLQEIDFAIQLIASNLHIQHRALGDDPWGPFPLSFHSAGIWSLSTGQVSIHKGKVFLFPDAKENALRLGFTAKKQDILKDLKQDPWQAVAQIPETPCDTIRAAMPAKALPLADEFRLEGTLALKFALHLISADSSPLDWDPKQQEFNCRPIQVSQKYSRSALTQRIRDIFPEKEQDNPSLKAFLSSEYVPLKQIPEDFFTGIISAEDSSFWSHEGVRLGSLKAALQANLKAGKFVYGASTITMQLVKNLFLNRGKIMSRKVQEIILAWLIEHELEKETILEIYANIVEFGPNIYGIGAASRTFFAKYPEDLTRAEAVYLASVLPNPRLAFEQNVCQGSLHKDWAERMEKTALGIKLMIQDKDWYTHFRKDLSSLRFEDGLKQRFCHLPLANSRDHTTAPRF